MRNLLLISLQTYRCHQPFSRSSRDSPGPFLPRCIRIARGQWAGGPEVKQTADSPLKWGVQGRRQKDGPGNQLGQECQLGWLRAWRVQTVGCSREPHRWEPPYNSASPELGPRPRALPQHQPDRISATPEGSQASPDISYVLTYCLPEPHPRTLKGMNKHQSSRSWECLPPQAPFSLASAPGPVWAWPKAGQQNQEAIELSGSRPGLSPSPACIAVQPRKHQFTSGLCSS